jgi:nitroreductase
MHKYLILISLYIVIPYTLHCNQPHQVKRTSHYPIDSLFLDRWSSRAMSGDTILEKELMTLFEAARWAPSSSNGQPWKFFYAMKDTPEWSTFYNLLVDFNKEWAKNASVLVIIVSDNTRGATHSFDTGAAWMCLSLQGQINNLVVHGMAGFDYVQAHKILKLPDNFVVQAMAAIGKPGKIEDLPDYMKKLEVPSSRNPITQFVYKGCYTK